MDKLKEGTKYVNLISHLNVTLYKKENNFWYLHVSPEDKKRGFVDGAPCTEKEMQELLSKRFKRIE